MFLNISNCTTLLNEPLKNHCSFNIGGNAKFFISTHSIDALLDVLNLCNKHCIKYKIIGNGSNLLFDDKGFDGAIIKYDNSRIKLQNNILHASAGIELSALLQYCLNNSLGGLEFSVGVPAQLGGAIINNLGAYDQEISTYIQHITILKNNHIIYLTKDECDFNYHLSNLQHSNNIILASSFNLPTQDKDIIQTKMIHNFKSRSNSQPLNFPNAGSVFKRSGNIVPPQLIDNAGLKGLCVNNAEVSTKHAGFIINKGHATCKDVLALIEIIKHKIFEKYGVQLTLEIEYVSF